MCRNRATMPVPITAPRNASGTPSPSVTSCHCRGLEIRPPPRSAARHSADGPVSTPAHAGYQLHGCGWQVNPPWHQAGYPVRYDGVQAAESGVTVDDYTEIPTRLLP